MIRPVASRPMRAGLAAAGIVGAFALAGCAGTTVDSSESPDNGSADTPVTSDGDTYTDGTYTAEGSYATPESVESITVTVTLEDDIITAVDVTGNPSKHESEEFQARFIGGIADVVIGEDIDELSVSRVAGSSLTSGGFNEAIEVIKSEAAA